MSELENPIQPTELVHTPKDMKELIDTLNRLNGEERIVAYTYSMMAWNLACKITTDHLKEQAA